MTWPAVAFAPAETTWLGLGAAVGIGTVEAPIPHPASRTAAAATMAAIGSRLIRAASRSTARRSGGRGDGRRSGRPTPDVRRPSGSRRRRCPPTGRTRRPPRTAARATGRRRRSARPPSDVLARQEQDVGRGARRDVADGDDEVVRRGPCVGRDLAGDDPAEQAVRIAERSSLTSVVVQLRASAWRSSGSRWCRPDRPSRTRRSAGDVRRPPGRVVPRGPQPDQPAQVRPLDEEGDAARLTA